MSFEITTAMVAQFKRNCILLSQQKASLLEEYCQRETVEGKEFYAERIGKTKTHTRTTRHSDVTYTDTPHSRRKGTIYDEEVADLIDKSDRPKVLIDINGKYVQNFVAAINRAKDMYILRALGGAAYGGEAGGTTVNNYDSGECRLVAGDGTVVTAGSNHSDTTATALTVAKVRTCKYLLDKAQVDPMRRRVFVLNAYNLDQLLTDTTYGSEEWKQVRDIKDGKVDKFLGFFFKQIEYDSDGTGLSLDATETDCVNCYAFAEGGVSYGVGEDMDVRIERVPTKNADQVLGTISLGATRNEGPTVVEINLLAGS